MNNKNSAFSFSVNFSDVDLYKEAAELVEGYYKVTITEAYIDAERNANRVIFKLAFKGDYKGNTKLTGLNLPGTTKGDVRGLWMNLMVSAGYDLDQLKTGEVEVSAANLTNREACLFFRPKDATATEGNAMYDTFKFLTEDNWEKSKSRFDAKPTTVSNAIPKSSGTSAGFAGASISSQDLLNIVKG